jgi:hypothetical protein
MMEKIESSRLLHMSWVEMVVLFSFHSNPVFGNLKGMGLDDISCG